MTESDHTSHHCAQCDAPMDEDTPLCGECRDLLALDEENHQLTHQPGAV